MTATIKTPLYSVFTNKAVGLEAIVFRYGNAWAIKLRDLDYPEGAMDPVTKATRESAEEYAALCTRDIAE